MTIEYLKRASKTLETETGTVTIVPLKDETGRGRHGGPSYAT
jgi:hypothetical protein